MTLKNIGGSFSIRIHRNCTPPVHGGRWKAPSKGSQAKKTIPALAFLILEMIFFLILLQRRAAPDFRDPGVTRLGCFLTAWTRFCQER